jgi:putative transposase
LLNEHGLKSAWQEGYAAFGVSVSNVPTVVRYIANEQAHHRKISFKDEYALFLKKHGISFERKF